MKKIIIVGSAGTGKSTLARAIHSIMQTEVFHLDLLFWKPGWVRMPKEAWIEIQQKIVQEEEWIIDGNYPSTIDIRLNVADTIIFLDMPRLLCIWRVIKRHILYFGRSRPDLPKGCPEKITWSYLKEVWNFPNSERMRLLEKLHSVSAEKQIIRLTSSRDVSTFLKKLQTVCEKQVDCSS